ncbi:MAG TPA: hypothetical protein VN905_14785 [Candidatus Binatia bacterium]|nr:hypothetical protein [Candidatus Binatia bacterium]
MRVLRLLQLVAICVALLPFAPARAQSDVPVRLSSCAMMVSFMYVSDAALIAAAFTNLGKLTADWIDFRIWWGDGTDDTMHDVGSFLPGATIKHNWYVGLGIRQIGPTLWSEVRAYPSRVHYADGSEWQSPYARLPYGEEYAKEKPSSTRCRIYPI